MYNLFRRGTFLEHRRSTQRPSKTPRDKEINQIRNNENKGRGMKLFIRKPTPKEVEKFNKKRKNKIHHPADYKPHQLYAIDHLSGTKTMVFSKQADLEYVVNFIKKVEG